MKKKILNFFMLALLIPGITHALSTDQLSEEERIKVRSELVRSWDEKETFSVKPGTIPKYLHFFDALSKVIGQGTLYSVGAGVGYLEELARTFGLKVKAYELATPLSDDSRGPRQPKYGFVDRIPNELNAQDQVNFVLKDFDGSKGDILFSSFPKSWFNLYVEGVVRRGGDRVLIISIFREIYIKEVSRLANNAPLGAPKFTSDIDDGGFLDFYSAHLNNKELVDLRQGRRLVGKFGVYCRKYGHKLEGYPDNSVAFTVSSLQISFYGPSSFLNSIFDLLNPKFSPITQFESEFLRQAPLLDNILGGQKVTTLISTKFSGLKIKDGKDLSPELLTVPSTSVKFNAEDLELETAIMKDSPTHFVDVFKLYQLWKALGGTP